MINVISTYRLLSNTCKMNKAPLTYMILFISTSVKNYEIKQLTVSKLLQAKIKTSGPITVSDYMKEALTAPKIGYYMNKDVFGKDGDFITSPEISQMFGELIAVWFLNEWHRLACPGPLQLVELGPGRGSMLQDILRVYVRLTRNADVTIIHTQDTNLTCHLVEISPELSLKQAEKLCVEFEKNNDESKRYYMSGITKDNIPVYWYHSLTDVPKSFTLLVAHEFFDALPIHKLQKTETGWAEILIDIDQSSPQESKFRYVLAKSPTPASKFFVKKNESRNHIEVSPASYIIMKEIAHRLEEDGGIALIADYGHNGSKTDTFRAFRNHTVSDPLQDPGTADLTADVDFSYLKEAVSDKLLVYGPVTQNTFFTKMHINVRMQSLLQGCTEQEAASIKSGYHMMMDEDKMGERFKFMALFPKVLEEFLSNFPIAGFE